MANTTHGGHGGAGAREMRPMDPGAVGSGTTEYKEAAWINNQFIQATKWANTSDYIGRTVNENLYNIAQNINRVANSSNINISHHFNAFNGKATGVEVWYFLGDEKGRQIATKLSAEISKALGLPNRGAKATTSLYVIRNTNGTSILIEWAFIDNPNDMKQWNSKKHQAVNAALKVLGYGGVSPENKPEPSKQDTFFGHIDRYAVGSREINIEGWFLTTDSVNETFPYILFMDGNGKEITRLRAERVIRDDLRQHFPHTANWHKSGFKIKTVMPDILKGKGFHLLARMARTEGGEKPLYEHYFDGVYSAPPKLNTGHIDGHSVVDGRFYCTGWSFGDNIYKGLHRYAFLLDPATHREIKRVKIDSVPRPDVQKVYPQYYLVNESGFRFNLDVSDVPQKEVKLLVRYSSDPEGNKTVSETLFNKPLALR